MTTRISTDGIADDAITAAKIANNAVGSDQIAAGSVTAAKIASGAVPLVLGVRQTVHGGPTSSGLPNFFPASTYSPSVSSLNLTTSGLVTDPLVVSASQGFGSGCERVGSSNVELTWTALTASQTNYLFVDVGSDGALTTGHTTTAPVYSYTASSGTNTFNITTMTMYTTGTTKGWRVFVGEAVTGVAAVTSVVMYAYNGRFSSYGSAVTPLPLTHQDVTHNIGVIPKNVTLFVECITAQSDFVAGDVVAENIITYNGANVYPTLFQRKAKKVIFRASASWHVFNYAPAGTQTSLQLTVGSWKYWIEADRGW